jgi:hypothetical protein
VRGRIVATVLDAGYFDNPIASRRSVNWNVWEVPQEGPADNSDQAACNGLSYPLAKPHLGA